MHFFVRFLKFNIFISVLVILSVPLFALGQESSTAVQKDQCIRCHTENDALPEHFTMEDIHIQEGLSCAGCHGGDRFAPDADEAMNPAKGFVGVPARKEIPAFCGKCHSHIKFMRKYKPGIPTDQEEQYFTSMHGKLLLKKDQKVAVCTSCHTAHSIYRVSDSRSTVYPINVPATCGRCHSDAEYMKQYSIPTDQLQKYKQSVHGIALLKNQDTGAPACNDCHGNHGAMPPGVNSIAYICGNCHVNNKEYFLSSKMGKIFGETGLHACEECHNNHLIQKPSDEMVGTGEKSVCLNCHDEGDEGFQVAKNISVNINHAVALYDSARILLTRVRRIGMDDVDLGYLLQDAHQAIIHSRTIVHTFDSLKVKQKTDTSIKKSTAAIKLAISEIKESKFRRQGFGIATLFITLLIIFLYIKLRQIEKK